MRFSTKHNACEYCSVQFDSGKSRNKHEEDFHHACHVCRLMLGREADLVEHNVRIHNMCRECKDYLNSPQALEQVNDIQAV
jgi:hypothetical protein